jgi:hypothetical protein
LDTSNYRRPSSPKSLVKSNLVCQIDRKFRPGSALA